MEIGYKKIWGILSLMVSSFNCCLAAAFVRIDNAAPPTLGVIFWLFIVYGGLLLTRNYIEVGKDTLLIKSLIGFGTKRYEYQSASDFYIEKDNVFIMNNGTNQKLPVAKWLGQTRLGILP